MEKLNNPSEFSLIFKYALKDLSRNYHKISSIILTLFISLFILSAIFTIEDSLKKELNDNAKALLGGDLEIDYNRNPGNLDLVNQVKEFATVSQMIEFSTMLSTTGREKNKSLFTRIKTVDEKYPLYGNVVYEPIGAYERMQKEPYSILINESLSKTLNIKINEKVKVQDQNFTVIGIIKSVPDVSGFVAFGDWALAGKQTLEILKLNGIGSFLNYEYKVKFNEKDKPVQKIPFASLIDNGHLKPGSSLYNNNKNYKATVLPDGSITYKNDRGSIHKIAAKILGSESCNGWTFWHYQYMI